MTDQITTLLDDIDLLAEGFQNPEINAATTQVLAEYAPHLAQAIRAALVALDDYPIPEREDDPTGEAASALQVLEHQVRGAITEALEGHDDR